MWVHCSLDSLAGTTQGHSTHVFCAVLLIASLFVSCPFSCKPEYCWQQISLPTARAVFSISFSFFLMLLKAVVRAGTSLHIEKVSLTCHFWSSACWVGVACHRALVSPQWLTTLSRKLPTDRCWLTNQQLSTTNLCCGPSRLTAFCVTVIELNRW